ncbi:AAA family ATPase [Porphyromonas sp.]|uniref:AAA family ATPase n=1 Tax=Porphyromonas sp. TaxID=1924944 RepID=UPI0026DAD19C|nr:AAA family ATPase [Porphyromonas sp.]MDO4770323.1 AAA family ATPase [Porphyromonas sp.]
MNIKINISELTYMLDRTPATHNIMLTGRHGIGKSEILTAYFARKGMKIVTLFLGQMSDPGDLIGLPDKSGELTVFRPPYWFPMDGHPIVLFLDELNRARPEVLQTIMDLALNRKLAGRALPVGSRVIAAVNEGDEYQLTDLDPALVSRFNVFRFEPTVHEWLEWGEEIGLDERVITFIRENPEWLDKDPQLEENPDTGLDKMPDRRSWKRVSDVILGVENLDQRDIKLISSIVGHKAANVFISKIGQIKQVDVADFLRHFDDYEEALPTFKTHDFSVINEDIFKHIHITYLDDATEDIIAPNLSKYIAYIESEKKNEVLASFAHLFQQDKYEQTQEFIMRKCPQIAQKLFSYTANIR